MDSNVTVNAKNAKSKLRDISNQVDPHLTYRVNQWLFEPLGLWPLTKESSFIERISKKIRIIVCLFFLAFVIVPGLFLFFQAQGIAARIQVLTGPFIFYAMSLMKYILFVFGQQNFTNCIQHISADWQSLNSVNDRKIMVDNAKYGKVAAVICAICMYSGGILYVVIFPLISPDIQTENNETIRPLAFPGHYIFFDEQKSPMYGIVYCLHCCCGFILTSITTATCSLAVVLVIHACGQLEIINSWIEDLVVEEQNSQDNNKKSVKIIHHHVNTLKFIKSIDKLLCQICLVEVVGCTLSICVLGYNVLKQWSEGGGVGTMAFATLLVSFTFNIFLLCYIGDLLIEKCQKVGETVYLMNWYQMPSKTALGLRIIIIIAQNPVMMTAGKIFSLSLRNFVSIVQTAVVYLNILRKFQE